MVLPQLSVIDYDSENFISLEDFNEKKLTRMDVVNFMNSLITEDEIYKDTANIPNALNLRRMANDF